MCTRIGQTDLGVSSGEKAIKLLENLGIDESTISYEARTLQLLGILYFNKNNYARSVQVLQRLLNILKKYEISSVDSSLVKQKIVDCLVKSHKPNLAKPYLEEMLNENRSFANLLKYGKIFMALEEFEQAEKVLKELDELNHKDESEKFMALTTLSLAQVKKKDFVAAQRTLEKSAKLIEDIGMETNPEILWVYSQLGQIYYANEKLQQAQNTFRTFLVLSDELKVFDNEYGSVLVNLGKIHSKFGEKVEALKFLNAGKRILEGFKKENGLEANLAILEVYLKDRNVMKAWEILQEIEKSQYSPLVSALAENEMGNLLREFGHLDQGLHYYEEALMKYKVIKGEESEEAGKVLFNIGSLLSQQGKYSLALEYLSGCQTIKLKFSTANSLDLANVYVEIGKCLFQLGRKAYGRELQQKGKRIISSLT